MNIKECIEFSVASDNAVSSVFKDLRDIAIESITSTFFIGKCTISEIEFMEEYYSEDTQAKKKNGDWKFRTYLPGSYNTSKSILSRALDANIDLAGKGKTAIEKELKQAVKDTKPTKTPFEKAMLLAKSLNGMCSDLDLEELNTVTLELSNIHIV